MAQNTQANGKATSEKVKVPKHLSTELCTKAPSTKTLNVAKVFSPGLIRNPFMMENGETTSSKDKVSSRGTINGSMLVNFIMIYLTGRVS